MKTVIEFGITFCGGVAFGTYFGIYLTHKLVGDVHFLLDRAVGVNKALQATAEKVAGKL